MRHPYTCRYCGSTHAGVVLAPGERASCPRCGTTLACRGRLGAGSALAFAATAALLAVPAFTLPLITVSRFGNQRSGLLFSEVSGMWRADMPILAAWVLICACLAPLFLLIVLFGLLASRHTGWRLPGTAVLFRLTETIKEWAMPEVEVLAVLVAITKLGSLVNVTVGPGFWCYGGMALALLLAWRNFTLELMTDAPPDQAVAEGTGPLDQDSRVKAIALAVAAAALLVMANILPVIRTTIGLTRDDTIFTGIENLFERGLWDIGIIVFVASIIVPLLKLAGLAYLVRATTTKHHADPCQLTRLYGMLEFIGSWSMLDVFLISFLTGVVQFGSLASVQPRPGILAFAAAVVLTMLATRAFDPRLLWQVKPQPLRLL